MIKQIKSQGKKEHRIFSFYPVDKGDCECRKEVRKFNIQLAGLSHEQRAALVDKMGHITCSRDKSGMQKYQILCNRCGEIQGEVYATDEKLTDWCDLHYISSCRLEEKTEVFTDKVEVLDKKGKGTGEYKDVQKKRQVTEGYWFGCFTPHISPITQELCFECACGNDTRDMRLNQTLPKTLIENMESRNVIGRIFGKEDSKYKMEVLNG